MADGRSTEVPAPEADGNAAIRVLIVDDHGVLAGGLEAALGSEPGIEVVGVADSVDSARRAVARELPDVVLMDYALPDGNGIDCGVDIKDRFTDTRIVILTGQHDDAVVARTVQSGIDGFLRKTATIDQVISAVRRAHAGEAVFSPDDLLLVMRSARESSPTDLTRRELEVLQLLAAGTSTTDMAERLYVSQHTVRSHVRNILEKLGAHSKLEAVAMGLREGLVAAPSSPA